MTDITIGFNKANYTVRESDGSVLLQISLRGMIDENVTVTVRLNTVIDNGSRSADSKHCTYVHFC